MASKNKRNINDKMYISFHSDEDIAPFLVAHYYRDF